MKILIVDDEPIIRDLLEDILLSDDHEITKVENGMQGLEAVREGDFSLVFSDINMPVMEGIEMLHEINQFDNPPKVIILTGFADVDAAVEAIAGGAYDFMLKPIKPEDITNQVRKIQRELDLMEQIKEERRKSVFFSRMAAVGELSAGVAHEINNPTTFVRGNTQIIQNLFDKIYDKIPASAHDEELTSLFDMSKEMVSGILNGTQRIEQITAGLIAFSNKNVIEERSVFDICECLEGAMLLVSEAAGKHDIQIEGCDEAMNLYSGRRDITQVLLCIIRNAIQGTPPGEKIKISVAAVGDHIQILIDDSGKGISEDLHEKIFEPFFTTKEVGEGAGLGLAMSYGIIVNDHGGSLKVVGSQLGGACFEILLPAHTE